MTGYAMRLLTDRLAPGIRLIFDPGLHRVIYVAEGSAGIAASDAVFSLAPNSVWYGSGAVAITAGAQGARLLRYELLAGNESNAGAADGEGVECRRTLGATFDLDSARPHLLRCDRINLPPGSVRHLHDQVGPGIRCLQSGSFRVEMGGKSSLYRPGGAWFEPAFEPVVAHGSETETSHFIRVLVLPRDYLGRRSSRDLSDEDRGKTRPQSAETFIDTPIAL